MIPALRLPGRDRSGVGRGDHASLDRALLARAVYGSVLLVAPAPILRHLPAGQAVDRRALVAARVIGTRHLVQAAILTKRRSRGWMLGGAAIDATHAATMLALAIARPNRRTLATASATVAALSAAWEVREGIPRFWVVARSSRASAARWSRSD